MTDEKTSRVILADVPLGIVADEVARSLHIEEGTEKAALVERLLGEAEKIARPKALYIVSRIEERGEDYVVMDGERFTSRVMAVNLAKAHKAFPFVVTCGLELDEWTESLADPLEKFIAGAFRVRGLFAAIRALDAHAGKSLNSGRLGMMNPGSIADWPLSGQKPLFALLGDTASLVGVTLLESLFMSPGFSASGIKFPTETSYENCMLCEMEYCPGRRAPYDPGLYERKFAKK